MDYCEMFQEENESIQERYTLSMERIHQIKEESSVAGRFVPYFHKTAGFILQMEQLSEDVRNNRQKDWSLKQLQQYNHSLYEDILPENYADSYANPEFAVKMLGMEYGRMLSALYKEIRGMIVYAYECRLKNITIYSELFIEIYNCFEALEEPDIEEIRKIIYWFFSDYSDETIEYRIREQLDSSLSFATDIIMNSDLSDLRYLYRFGEYITDNELRTAQFLNSFSQKEIDKMAYTFTEGYHKGFENANKDLSKKEIVNIRYHLGFERIIKAAILNFEQLGLRPTFSRQSVSSVHSRIGYSGADANKQYDYDHKNDNALYMDKAYMERRLGALKAAYEKHKELASLFAGPACMEIFGEKPFVPEVKQEAYQLSDKQQKLAVAFTSETGKIVNQYIKGEERSFVIMAFPMPEIGDNFEEIFREIEKINTLDYQLYQSIQQRIIDVLDQGQSVHVKGMGKNRTDIQVQLHPLKNPAKETIFENCVADVNIPVGEVFTSPRLKGTDGILHVTKVYLNELEFRQLEIHFKNGMITEYNCANFDEPEKNLSYIRDNILNHHETLPMGEFAIGTNTTAYVMAEKYQIADKLPILIAEKMGPHFAVGDTCYSWEEDTKVYNPDGKEIIARENEVSALRKEDFSKAYFNCHTDITIPYDELGSLEVVKQDGTRITVIQNGRFVLAGTEPLNEPFQI